MLKYSKVYGSAYFVGEEIIMKNFKGKLLMLVSILIPVFMFVGCSEEKKLTEEDVSFSFEKKKMEKILI